MVDGQHDILQFVVVPQGVEELLDGDGLVVGGQTRARGEGGVGGGRGERGARV